jgi:hypothetical protein
MKTNFLFLILTLVTANVFGQITFEKGYLVDNQNLRIECLIKNTDWKSNPAQFDYKLTESGNVEKGTLNTAKEFGVTGFSRYVRADVKIDVSPADLDNLSKERNPVWSQERLFLKVLVEGKAILYYYENNGLIRFFYSVSDTTIKQLIYKEYYTNDNQVAENFKFREQLWTDVRLANAGMNSVENIRCNVSDLVRYFKKYNGSEGNSSIANYETKKKDSFHLRVTPGINYSWASVSNADNPDSYTDLGSQINFRMGVEAEFILPFNKNKWGIFVDPSYQYFKSSGQHGSETIDINYQSIEFPLGLRHYFFLNNDLKVFVNALFIPAYSIVFNSTISYLEVITGTSYAVGGGIGYKKLSAEMRYSTNRDLLRGYLTLYNDYQRFSLILGFRIL